MTIQNLNSNSLIGKIGTFAKPVEIMKEDPQPSVETTQKQSMDALKVAAELGKSLVRKPQLNNDAQNASEISYNVCSKLNDKIDICDEKVKSKNNAFSSIEDFKNAGGSFDKYGTALINGKPFNGVIRLKYDEKYPEDTVMSRYNSRQYAMFDNDGYLNQVLTVDNNWAKVTLDTIQVVNPGSRVAEYEIITEQFDINKCPNKGNDVLLDKYGIG